jgi:hypothetical protein
VILLTDAGVGGYNRITRTVSDNYENADKETPVLDPQNRVFVLGVGTGVSSSLCTSVAKAGGGIAAFAQETHMIDESMTRLLGYASRKPPMRVKTQECLVALKNGNGDQIQVKRVDEFENTGMPGSIFGDSFAGPIGEWLSDEISHYKYGCILEPNQVTNGLIADVKVDLAVEQNSNDRALAVLQRTKEARIQVDSSRTNPLYFSYVKDELGRLQKYVDDQEYQSHGIRDEAERAPVEEKIAQYKEKIVNLSSTTRLLSPLTAFVGVRKDSTKRKREQEQQAVEAKRPTTHEAMDVDEESNSMHASYDNHAAAPSMPFNHARMMDTDSDVNRLHAFNQPAGNARSRPSGNGSSLNNVGGYPSKLTSAVFSCD